MSGFVDEAQIHVKAGNGGAGSVSFRREAHVPRGGPDGGSGGRGGDVWLVADHDVASLLSFKDRPHRAATSGGHGAGRAKHGASGKDTVVRVPQGTVVKDLDGNVVADLVRHGDRFQAAAGGKGGRGNATFLSNRRRAPTFAEQGELGEEHWYDLELKLMGDVALVGFPNVGKSTFISRVSAAKPKIADYPFTTLEPNLGVVRLDDDTEFVVADIPGLIEGASEGRGLGHQFLRHIERARVLLVLVDLAPADGRPPADQERILLDELGRYRLELAQRPRVVVGSKADRPDAVGPDAWPGPRISAVTGDGLRPLLFQLAGLVAEARASAAAELEAADGFVIHRPAGAGVSVERTSDGGWAVLGKPAERAVALSDLTDAGALAEAQRRLERLGVGKALARAGAHAGDTVRIAGFEFDYQPD
jgi:GTP-binding protein